jgi:hypothetical protein
MADTKQSQSGKDDLHRERSRFLDAFAGLEETLNQIPEALSDDQLLKEVKELRLIRNDLVHSQLKFAAIGGALHAIAINSQHAGKLAPPARLIQLKDFQALQAGLNCIQKKIKSA